MSTTDRDHDPDLGIDKDRLDEEWEDQPDLYHHWAEQLADARHDLEVKEFALETAEADCALDIRRFPDKYNVPKVTEDVVSKLIVLQPEYIRARNAVINARHEMETLRAKVTALDHRKKALENMVQLRLSDYFSEPTEPVDYRKQRESDRVRSTLRNSVKRINREESD